MGEISWDRNDSAMQIPRVWEDRREKLLFPRFSLYLPGLRRMEGEGSQVRNLRKNWNEFLDSGLPTVDSPPSCPPHHPFSSN